jgi:hypothetical protein
MTLLTPKAGSKLIAISIYMPQHNTNQGNKTYKETLQWLMEDLPHAAVILGGDLQATPSVGHPSYYQALDLFCTSIRLRFLGDSCTLIFTPTSSPLDHWLFRLPTNKYDSICDHTYTTPSNTTYNDHRALTANIPQVGNPTPQIKHHTTSIPTTRNHPPFTLPIPKPLIDLYQLGDNASKLALDEAQTLLSSLRTSTTTTKDIDNAAKLVLHTITQYHHLAQSIWPMTHPSNAPHQTKLHTPINNSDKQQIKRITRLKYLTNNHQRINTSQHTTSNRPATDTTLPVMASEVLKLDHKLPSIPDFPTLCNRAITTILSKPNKKLMDFIRKTEDELYKRAPNDTTTT